MGSQAAQPVPPSSFRIVSRHGTNRSLGSHTPGPPSPRDPAHPPGIRPRPGPSPPLAPSRPPAPAPPKAGGLGARRGRVSCAQRRRPLPRHCAGRRRERACAAVCAGAWPPLWAAAALGPRGGRFPRAPHAAGSAWGFGAPAPRARPARAAAFDLGGRERHPASRVDVTRLSVAEGVGQPPGCPWAPAWDARVQSPLPLPSAPCPRCREEWASSGPLRAPPARPVPARCL